MHEAGFLQTLPHVPFLFADSALYPFPEINLSHKYNYMLSRVSPPSKLPNLRVVAGTPDISPLRWMWAGKYTQHLNLHGLPMLLAILPSLSASVPKEDRTSDVYLKEA